MTGLSDSNPRKRPKGEMSEPSQPYASPGETGGAEPGGSLTSSADSNPSKRLITTVATEVEKKSSSRVFEIADDFAASALLKWSEPLQLKLQIRDDGTYNLLARKAR